MRKYANSRCSPAVRGRDALRVGTAGRINAHQLQLTVSILKEMAGILKMWVPRGDWERMESDKQPYQVVLASRAVVSLSLKTPRVPRGPVDSSADISRFPIMHQ